MTMIPNHIQNLMSQDAERKRAESVTNPTPYKKSTRIDDERKLIGRALTCIHSALAIADILTAANFKDPLCQQLFELIVEGTDTVELDLTTITRKYHQKYGKVNAFEITALTTLDRGSTYVFEDAILLLETDIREKFCAMLSKKEQKAAKESDFEAAAIWKQCHDHIQHPGNDIFLAVDHIHAYLNSCFPDEIQEYNVLRDAVPKMIERIKQRAKTRKFLDTLTALGGGSPTHEHRMSISILSEWLIMCMGGKKLPEDFYATLTHLNQTWHG